MEWRVSTDTEVYLVALMVAGVVGALAFWEAHRGNEATAALLALLVTLILAVALC